MQQGVRAVEAYRRTLLVDGVTSDSETIAPVYKLEELCTLMRTSSLDIVRELLNRILKRLDHRSLVVKQKVRNMPMSSNLYDRNYVRKFRVLDCPGAILL